MVSDRDVWKLIQTKEGFIRFTEIKNALDISSQRLTTALRRLERSGEVLRKVGFYKDRPVNEYLAIDAENPRFLARIVDDHGWVFAILEWHDEHGIPTLSISFNLGELADYITFRRGVGDPNWPEWVNTLHDAGKVKFEETESMELSRPVRTFQDLPGTKPHRFLS